MVTSVIVTRRSFGPGLRFVAVSTALIAADSGRTIPGTSDTRVRGLASERPAHPGVREGRWYSGLKQVHDRRALGGARS